MFDRRAKIFLFILMLLTCALVARALQVQVLQRGEWDKEAIKIMSTGELIETTRGRLLDRRGRAIADNDACIDVSVDYRAIMAEPDETWVAGIARARLRNRIDGSYSQSDALTRKRMLAEEMARVLSDIRAMWQTLARFGGKSVEEMDDLRESIVKKVDMRRRFLWYRNYELELAKRKNNKEVIPWYRQWLTDDSQEAPQVDQYFVEVREQKLPHVILPNISSELANTLAKHQDQFPGLVLQPGIHRVYPYKEAGAHLIGRLSSVSQQDLKNDPSAENDLRRYWRNDLIGRSGLEAMGEPILRGLRGRKRYVGDESRIVEDTPPVAGMDVRTTIDIELQQQIEQAFTHVVIEHKDNDDPSKSWKDTLEMPGAAVVIDVETGEVLAMASYPGFDINSFDELYPVLAADQINRRLVNRATQFALEPGSTVKPIVGLSAITQGLFSADAAIECTGYLQIGGRVYKNQARCWVASMYEHILKDGVAHHPIPVPHPTGFLTLADALERSCNIYFETMADKMGMEGLRYWYDRFGLGRPTGIGLPERSGTIPGDVPILPVLRKSATWFSGIGQGQVLATPIQMANVAATIARDGVWVRPHLVPPGTEVVKPKSAEGPDRVDLKLSREALAMARDGMMRVVNSPAGTGTSVHRDDLLIAGKTGTAQAQPLKYRALDDTGRPIAEPQKLRTGSHANPNPLAPWYRGIGDNEDRLAHSWYMGFAPANKPKIAFAVMVEYGGSGGKAAGYVARQVLDACIERGYLARSEHASGNP